MIFHALVRPAILLTLCLLLFACSKGDDSGETLARDTGKSVPTSDEVTTAAAAGGVKTVSSDNKHDATIQVYLTPQPASREHNLQAIVNDSQGIPTYRWFVGDEEIVDIDGPELPGEYIFKGEEIQVEVSEGNLTAVASVQAVNSPPRLIADSITCGMNQPIIPETTDADGDEVTIRYLWMVDGLQLNYSGNNLTYEQVSAGEQVSLQIFISDGEIELPVYECYEFEVPNGPPTFVSVPPDSFSGHLYEYQPVAVDPEETNVSYHLESAPDGMFIDPETARISWKISAESLGEHTVSIVATDEDGQQATQDYTINLSLQGTP